MGSIFNSNAAMINGQIPPIPSNQQVVLPQITIPKTVNQMVARSQPINQITIHGGEEVAKKYVLPPSSRVAIFDDTDPLFFFKETDENGNEISFMKCSYEVIPDPPEPEYVTVQDLKSMFEDFRKNIKEDILNDQSIRSQTYH